MNDVSDGSAGVIDTSQIALNRDAVRVGAELVRLDGGTDPFAAVVRATRMPIVITDPRQPDNPVVFANDSFCRLTGYARDEILGRNCRFLQGPDTDPETVKTIRAAVNAAEPIEIDIRNYRKNGEAFWNSLLLAPVCDAAGEVAFFFASQVDVTPARERLVGLESRNTALMAEVADRARALEGGEARLRDLVDTLDLATVAVRDLNGTIRFWSQGCAALYGWTAEEAMGRNIHELLQTEFPFPLSEIEAALLRDGEWRGDLVHRRRDGSRLVAAARKVLRRDEAGRPAAVMESLSDVTVLREAQEALQRLNTELEQRVEARTAELVAAEAQLRQRQKMESLGQLTGGIAHDFNNMLQAISGSLDMIHRRVGQGRAAEVGRYLDPALATVERAAALTHRLLAFARRQPLQPRPVEPDSLIESMADLIRRTVGPGVALELHRDGDVWTVLCDPNQLENVLLNLAINARDAMPDGGKLTLGIEGVRLGHRDVAGQEGVAPGDYVEVSVADTGSGMDEVTQARAFEPFFTTKPLGQGTGLGLSQLYGFVRQSGGMVRLDSAPGQGTTVRLYLPRHAASAQNPQAQQQTERQDARIGRPGWGETVLLVEDEEGVRASTAEHLRDLGYQILEAADGPAALRLLSISDWSADLLVTDVGLPGGMNGRQVAEAVRQSHPGLPVLFITGYAGDALTDQLASGMAIIGKPFALNALSAKVESMLAAKSAKSDVVSPGAENGVESD